MDKYDEIFYCILSDPVTPNEIAKKLKVMQKTAQRILMRLALTRENVKCRNSGRIHIFWKWKNKMSTRTSKKAMQPGIRM
jgi:predicted transcriptional regulator